MRRFLALAALALGCYGIGRGDTFLGLCVALIGVLALTEQR